MAEYMKRVMIAVMPVNQFNKVNPAFVVGHGKMVPSEEHLYWQLPGGKVEAGEALVHAAYRELHEEFGIIPRSTHAWRIIDTLPSFKTDYDLTVPTENMSEEQLDRRRKYCGFETFPVGFICDEYLHDKSREVRTLSTMTPNEFRHANQMDDHVSPHHDAFEKMISVMDHMQEEFRHLLSINDLNLHSA